MLFSTQAQFCQDLKDAWGFGSGHSVFIWKPIYDGINGATVISNLATLCGMTFTQTSTTLGNTTCEITPPETEFRFTVP